MRIRRVAMLLLACLLAAGSLTGGLAGTEGAYRKVNVAIASDPEAMSPWAGANVSGKVVVLASIYEPLFVLEQIGGEMKPCIASGYEQIDDYTYRVSLYPNVCDSAGNPITASDVVFSYETARALGNMATFLSAFKSIARVDDHTVDITLNSTEMGGILNSTTFVNIVSQKAYEADPDGFASNPVGTGPYMLKSWTPGASTILVKNPNFWQADDPHNVFAYQNCDEIEYVVYTEPAQIAIALETRQVDFAANVANSDHYLFGEGSQNENFTVYQIPAALSQVLLFNCSEGRPLADHSLRQAICYAIDSQAVLDGAYDGKGKVCKTYGNDRYADYVSSWDGEDYYDYNPDSAKKCLGASAYNGEPVVIMVQNMAAHIRTAEIIQAYLGEAGINAQIVNYDSTLYNTYRWDPTQWDIQVTNKGSGDYLANIWKYNFDARLFKGMGQMLIGDSHLQELLEACLSTKTHGDETMNAFHQYLKEMAYGYGMLYSFETFIFIDTIDAVAISTQNAVYPGACAYSGDFVSH